MTKPILQEPALACGCRQCRCRRGLRRRCHDYNALLALALWDYGRNLRRRTKRR